MTTMKQITDTLTDLVGEKFIAKEILDMKYAMEHKETMDKICNTFEDMTCVILNRISEEQIDDCPSQTHVIFHEKLDSDIMMDEAIEYYGFAFQSDEMGQFNYINNIIKKKGDLFLNQEEYLGIYQML